MTKEEASSAKYRVWYNVLHAKNIKLFGKASKCENIDCRYKNPKRYEWALKKARTYSSNRDDYIQLCPSCHRKYDETQERKDKIKADHIGKVYHNREKVIIQTDMADNYINEFKSIANAARQTGANRTGISNYLAGISSNCGGFKWHYKSLKQQP